MSFRFSPSSCADFQKMLCFTIFILGLRTVTAVPFIDPPTINGGTKEHPSVWDWGSNHHFFVKLVLSTSTRKPTIATTTTPYATPQVQITTPFPTSPSPPIITANPSPPLLTTTPPVTATPAALTTKRPHITLPNVNDLLGEIAIQSVQEYLDKNVTNEALANATQKATDILKVIKITTLPDINAGEDVVDSGYSFWNWIHEYFREIM